MVPGVSRGADRRLKREKENAESRIGGAFLANATGCGACSVVLISLLGVNILPERHPLSHFADGAIPLAPVTYHLCIYQFGRTLLTLV